jgi:hypothetical protein
MSLKDEIETIQQQVADGLLNQHDGNMLTSQRLAKARQELLQATQTVLSSLDINNKATPQSTAATALIPAQPSDETVVRQSSTNPIANPIFNGDSDIILTIAIQVRAFLDSFIATKTMLNIEKNKSK